MSLVQEREERVSFLRDALKAKFGNVGIWTNDDMNPATPIVTRVTFPGSRIHTFRAWTLKQTKEELAKDAISFLEKQRNRD